MARKPKPEPVDVPGDEEELEPTEGRGRSARKRASHELTKLGVELVGLRAAQLAALDLPEQLREAVTEARRLTSFGAQRRQAQFIGKLLRKLDEDAVAAIRKVTEQP
jgi:ribosome-associated protein